MAEHEVIEILEVTTTPNYIKIKLNYARGLGNKGFRDIEDWCNVTHCGKRVNLSCFAFKTEAEYAMFRLKWL